MEYKAPIEDIISSAISAMTFPVTIYKIGQAFDIWTLTVDNVYHAQVGSQNIVTIGGHPYTITGIIYNIADGVDQLTVQDLTGVNSISATSFNMYAPFFFYGTLTETGSELPTDNSQCSPMVFLRLDETLEETFHGDPQDSHERLTNCEIAFLAQNDYTQQTTGLISGAVTPMRRMMENFIEQVTSTVSTFEKLDWDYKVKYYTKVFVKADTKQIWSNQLSGVWGKFSLKILRPSDC